MKMNFKEAKAELKTRVSSAKYFNKDFYNRYRNALKKTRMCIENGIDDIYEKDGIRLFHSWDDVYTSDFYVKNSCAYCEFLCIVFGAELI